MACPLTSTGWPRRLKSMIKWIRLLSALFALGGALGHFPVAHAEDFLDPEAAVKFSARALDANTLEARWQIADGYYMYRDKFKFEVDGATLGTPQRPAGKVKHDDNFGTVETYRKDVRIALPIQRAAGVTSVTLKTVSQGCADAGLCYTPQSENVTIKLPAADAAAGALPAASAAAAAPSALDRLRSLGGDTGMPQLLPPDEAFLVKAAMPDAQTASWTMRRQPTPTCIATSSPSSSNRRPTSRSRVSTRLRATSRTTRVSAAPRYITIIFPPALRCRARWPATNPWCWPQPGRAAMRRSASATRRSSTTFP